jgi:hypothetical protein
MKSQSLFMLALASAVACKSVATPQARGNTVATPSSVDTGVTSEALPRATLDGTSATLPRLKPVTGKLYPDGTTEAMICEAINVKEPDLWLRFGHMIPMYTRGTVLVLQAGEPREADIAAFANGNKPKFQPIQASCGDKTLLYLVYVDDQTAVVNELEKRLDITVLERFDLPVDGRQGQRFSDYCRTDAALCDALHNIYDGSLGNGVCGWAIHECSFDSVKSKDYIEAVARCLNQPLEQVVCASILGTPSENSACTKRIRELYCPDFPKRANDFVRRHSIAVPEPRPQ